MSLISGFPKTNSNHICILQPLPEWEHNGPGIGYIVRYKNAGDDEWDEVIMCTVKPLSLTGVKVYWSVSPSVSCCHSYSSLSSRNMHIVP